MIRFLIGGGINTLATLALYWLLQRVMHYQLAYLVSYCAGIAISYSVNTRFVFRARHTWLKFAVFPLIYLITYVIGALVLRLSVHQLGVPVSIAPLVSIVATLPVSFLLTRFLLLRDHVSE
jgi:putative flippase GtrA